MLTVTVNIFENIDTKFHTDQLTFVELFISKVKEITPYLQKLTVKSQSQLTGHFSS